jgi:hypothetical protein
MSSVLAPSLAYWIEQDGSVELPPLEVTPVFSGGRTLAVLVRDRWRRVRQQALERAGNRCEVCGRPPTTEGTSVERHLHVHEGWRYDVPGRVQWLDRLWVLCRRCHGFAHLKPCWNLEPRPSREGWDRWYALADRAWVEAAPRRLVLFTIDLRCGRTPIPEAVAAAFARADRAGLPALIRRQIRSRFDQPLAQLLEAQPFQRRADRERPYALAAAAAAPGDLKAAAELEHTRRVWARRDIDLLLADRATALGQLEVLAALLEPPDPRPAWLQDLEAVRRPIVQGRHFYADLPSWMHPNDPAYAWWQLWRRWPWSWPHCHGCWRLQAADEAAAASAATSSQSTDESSQDESSQEELWWCPACQGSEEHRRPHLREAPAVGGGR